MPGPASLYGPLDPAPDAGWEAPPPRMGFFTDTSVCIGCKACEVACKEWNAIPDDGFNLLGTSYDNTGGLSANSWRHVAFIEQPAAPASFDALSAASSPSGSSALSGPSSLAGASGCSGSSGCSGHAAPAGPSSGPSLPSLSSGLSGSSEPLLSSGSSGSSGSEFLGMPGAAPPGATSDAPRSDFRWLMMSNVCKHCTHAGCLDVCPTGALFRTEFGTVVVQEDICNGCGYCIAGCPYGVIDRREDDGRAWKCTLCYDRIGDGLTPACAQACPTQSIQYGELDELRARAAERVSFLHDQGVPSAKLYGHDPDDGVGGDGAFFLLLDEPEVYGLPPDPVVPTRDMGKMWKRAGLAGLTMVAAAAISFLGGRS
jgi:formate dehydrogenase iron-sulfur subunit